MFSVDWARTHCDEAIANGNRPPTTFGGCLQDGFWTYLLQDWVTYVAAESDDAPQRCLELITWCDWAVQQDDPAAAMKDEVDQRGAGLLDDVDHDDFDAMRSALFTAFCGDPDGAGGDGFYGEMLNNAQAMEQMGTNRYGQEGVLTDPKDTELTGVLQAWDEDSGRFVNSLQDWTPTDADYDEVARVNAANVKAARDGARLPYVINGFLMLIGDGHDAYADWAQSREEKGVQQSFKGTVRVRKAGLTGAGTLEISDCPPVAQGLAADAVARFSEKKAKFV